MRKLSFVLCVCLALIVCTRGNAQDYSLQWKGLFKKSLCAGYEGLQIIQINSTTFVSFQQDRRVHRFTGVKFDLEHGTSEGVDYDLRKYLDGSFNKFVFHLDGKLYMFLLHWNSKTRTRIFYAQPLNEKTLEMEGKPKKISEVTFKDEGVFNYYFDCDYRLSPDKNKMLVILKLVHNGIIVGTELLVLDQELNTLWKTGKTGVNVGADLSLKGYEVDNEGNAYYYARTVPKNYKKKTLDSFMPQAFVVKMQKDNLTPVPIEIELPEDKYPTGITFGVNPKNELFFAGTYGQGNLEMGFFAAKISSDDNTVENVSLEEFGMDFITDGMNPKEKAKTIEAYKKNKTCKDCFPILDKIHFLNNGTFLFSFSNRRYVVNNSGSAFLCGDIYMANFSENAAFVWKQKIVRRTIAADHAILAYHAVLIDKKDNIHFCYNLLDNFRYRINILDKSQSMHVAIDAQGEKSNQKVLHNCRTDSFFPRVWEMTFIDGTETVFLPATGDIYNNITFTTFEFK